MNNQKERELKNLNDKVIRLQTEIDNNRKTYNQKIFDLNEKLREKDKEIRKIKKETNNYNYKNPKSTYDSKCIYIYSSQGATKSFSQDRKYYSQRSTKNTKFVEINNTSTRFSDSNKMDKIAYLNECLEEKEEELKFLKNYLEQKEKELKIYTSKNSSKSKSYDKYKYLKNNKNAYKNTNNITTNTFIEKELYENLEVYENEIEIKNKEIIILKKRIQTLILYLKRKERNILILDNELNIVEKQNEELLLDNNKLSIENKKLEKINDNLLNKKECICDIGLERYSIVVEQQKKDAENLRNRFNGLYKELNEYRKKNVELNKELKNLQVESSNLYKQNELVDNNLIIVDKSRKKFEEDIKKMNDKLKKLKKENDYLKSTLHINNIGL